MHESAQGSGQKPGSRRACLQPIQDVGEGSDRAVADSGTGPHLAELFLAMQGPPQKDLSPAGCLKQLYVPEESGQEQAAVGEGHRWTSPQAGPQEDPWRGAQGWITCFPGVLVTRAKYSGFCCACIPAVLTGEGAGSQGW